MAISTTRVIKNPLLHPRLLNRKILPAILAATLAGEAYAVEFQLGEVEGRFDSQLSAGASWRVNEADSHLISAVNGGTGKGSGSYDDGNQNFKQGETFSKILKGTHELTLNYENIGAFVRGKYWVDFELKNGNRTHGHNPNGYVANDPLNDDNFNDYAKFSGAEILDAYLYGNFDIGDKPLDVRLGRQVVNWGESTFIQGGINVINPIDVSAIRRPGAELKEALLPVNMAFASLGLTDNLSVEAFYQLEWEPTPIDGCGTYYSSNDFAAQGCNGIRITLPVQDNLYFNPTVATSIFGYDPVIYRNADGRREASNDNQFGLNARYLAESMNNTEFGLYYARYHSRLPISSAVNSTTGAATWLGTYGGALGAGATQSQAFVVATGTLVDTTYFVEYPEDIQMLGLSFNTNVGDIAWSGEISHKRDVPVQINGSLLVASILYQHSPTGSGNAAADANIDNAGAGGTIAGYTPFNITQFQTTAIKTINNVLGASRMALIGELGWTHIHEFDESVSAIKYGRDGVFGYAATDNDGFVTQDSIGYVVRASLSYPSAVAGINLTPQISFKHGISGYGPQPGAAFNEGEKSLNLSLSADYLERYSTQLSYTNYFGGDYNAIQDRDFISLSASVSF